VTYFNLQGKTALITGGTSGIGLAVAERFVKAGAQVLVVSRRSHGAEIAESIDAAFIQADVSAEDAVKTLFIQAKAQIGLFDILVLNAGDGTLGEPISDTATELSSISTAPCLASSTARL